MKKTVYECDCCWDQSTIDMPEFSLHTGPFSIVFNLCPSCAHIEKEEDLRAFLRRAHVPS